MKKRKGTLKAKVEWTVLIILVAAIAFAGWSNLFSYEYYYFKCQDRPTEVFGQYYRIPYDKGYGIHHGSDYSNCTYSAPAGKIRDPSTEAGAPKAAPEVQYDYDVYVPEGYKISRLATLDQGGGETSFTITTESGIDFYAREMSKDSDFSYTSLCSKPAEENWSGTIIGVDNRGENICRTNLSKYVDHYTVGINLGRTSIMLEAHTGTDGILNNEATQIFNSMKLYQSN